MPQTNCPETAIALFSEDGLHWFDAEAPDSKRPIHWEANENVTKIVIGTLERKGETPKFISTSIPDDLTSLYPNLTHLHLWQIENLQRLPLLPPKLQCLDVRGCGSLTKWTNLPLALESLVLDDCKSIKTPSVTDLRHLMDLSIQNCIAISTKWVQEVIRSSKELRFFNSSGCTQLVNLPHAPNAKAESRFHWPSSLVDLRLNGCSKLKHLGILPNTLRRLELRDCTSITKLPTLESTSVDYLNLVNTKSLVAIPSLPQPRHDDGTPRPRTLFLYKTGVKLERDLYGETEDTNVAKRYLADIDSTNAAGREEDHELKVFLLGNGRSGKSSLARRWVDGEFRENEKSTHGVRLWEKTIDFDTVDNGPSKAKLNIWDFAGQDLYHSTHKLFLQSRAIFIICDTSHPPGADSESDRRELAAIKREGEDVHRPIQYWLDQVKSLGKIPGLDSEPPVLIVHTKADRGPQENDGAISFSAKSGEGLSDIEKWVRLKVRESLGTFPERSLPKEAMLVKRELASLIEQNNKLYRQKEEDPRTFQSPFPTYSCDKFKELVRLHCSGGYEKNPLELLERFHRSGFLFYNKKYLASDIILDQRWVTQGIYTFASRQSDLHIRDHLIANHGQFTLNTIAELSWDSAGFAPQAQQLFISFMLACGMCFELLKPDESASGETVYAAPSFFPGRALTMKGNPEWFDENESATTRYELENVTESDMRSLIARIGSVWSRSMQAWKWGCRIRSYRTSAICVLDWARPDDEPKYSFPLVVRFLGPVDKSFDKTIRDIVNSCLSHAAYESSASFSEEWKERSVDVLEGESFPTDWDDKPQATNALVQSRTGEILATPPRNVAVGIRVAFSFAGSDKKNGLIGDIPSITGEIISQWLRNKAVGEALSYNRMEGEERLENFIQSLAKGDVVVVFWSEKYWHSKYCMTEMMLVYKAPPLGKLIDKRVLVYAIDDERLESDNPSKTKIWKDYWVNAATIRDKAAQQAAGDNLQEKITLLKDEGIVHSWFEFVADRHDFEPFVRTLMQYRLARSLPKPNSTQEAQCEAEKIASFIIELLQDETVLIDLAIQRFEQHREEDAITLLFYALAIRPDQCEVLRDQLNVRKFATLPERLRILALEYLSESNNQ